MKRVDVFEGEEVKADMMLNDSPPADPSIGSRPAATERPPQDADRTAAALLYQRNHGSIFT